MLNHGVPSLADFPVRGYLEELDASSNIGMSYGVGASISLFKPVGEDLPSTSCLDRRCEGEWGQRPAKGTGASIPLPSSPREISRKRRGSPSSGGDGDGAREARGTPLERAPWLGKWPDPSPAVTSAPLCKSVLVASRRITHRTSGTPRGVGRARVWTKNASFDDDLPFRCPPKPRAGT